MCGRYTLTVDPATLAEHFELVQAPELPPRYNIAPSQEVPAVRFIAHQGDRQLDLLRWGLIPPWAKDPAIGHRLINARAETVAHKPAFRAAFRNRRCLVVTDGFYEWKKEGGRKQPHLIRLATGQPFALAGLWERWKAPEGTEVETCTILTTTPNALIAPIHDRMPVILPPESYALWLDPQVDDAALLTPLLRPYPAEEMIAHPVSVLVNDPANDDPRCVSPLPEAAEDAGEAGKEDRGERGGEGPRQKSLFD